MKRPLVAENLVKGDSHPRHILVGDCWMPVENIVDHWRETGRWWAGESLRDFFLAETERGVFVVSRSDAGWQIEEALD